MADYRNDEDRTLPGGGMNLTPETDPEHLLPEATSASVPGTIGGVADDPDAVRGEIERTRARMSQTIDQLDRALTKKKDEIQERLDVAAPVRERPLAFAGGVFGAGLLLGFLTGGKDRNAEHDPDHVKIPRALLESIGLEEAHGPGGSGREWEGRARELMEVVARQEEQIRELRETVYGTRFDDHGVEVEYVSPDDARLLDDVEALGDVDVDDEWDEEWNFEEEDYDLEEGGSSLAKPIAGALAAGVAALVGGLVTRQVRNRGSDGMEVEVDLEPRHGSATDVRVDEEYRETRRETLGATGDLAYDATGRPRTGEMEVEVDLERPRASSGPRLPELPVSPLVSALAVGTAAAVTAVVARLIRNRGNDEEEMEVEVELERPSAYRPSQPQPRREYTTAPAMRRYSRGEMEVEVDLEEDRGRRNPPLM